MKRITILSCLCFLAVVTHAQSFVALTAGLHGTSTTPKFLNYPDTARNTSQSKAGVTFGFVANVPIQNGLFFHTGVLYTTKNTSWTQVYDTIKLAASKREQLLSNNTELNLRYIEIPLNLMYKTPAHGKTRFVMGAGPQLSMLYTGNTRFNSVRVSQTQIDKQVDYSYSHAANDDLPIGHTPGRYRIVHFTANTFAGLEFGRVFVTMNYSIGLNEFYQEEDRYYRHQTVGARIGIYMGKRTTSGSSQP